MWFARCRRRKCRRNYFHANYERATAAQNWMDSLLEISSFAARRWEKNIADQPLCLTRVEVDLFGKWISKGVRQMHNISPKWSGVLATRSVLALKGALHLIITIQRPSINGFTLPSAREVRSSRNVISYQKFYRIYISLIFSQTRLCLYEQKKEAAEEIASHSDTC